MPKGHRGTHQSCQTGEANLSVSPCTDVCTCPSFHSSRLPMWPTLVCVEAGVLGRRGFPLESAAYQVCREASRHQRAREGHRLGSLQRSGQPADTTLVSPSRRDGTARRRAANHTTTEQHLRRPFPELSGDGGRARLVVLAAEVGGRWSSETAEFLCALAKARAQSEPLLLQRRARAAWLRRRCDVSMQRRVVLHILPSSAWGWR